MDVRKKIMDNVCQAKTFLILTHVRPDGDAISSSIAMYYLLVSLGKDPKNIEVFIPYTCTCIIYRELHIYICASKIVILFSDVLLLVLCPILLV